MTLQRKSSYRILYNDEVVPDGLNVTLNAENVAVKTILDIVLQNTGLTFVMQSDELIGRLVVADGKKGTKQGYDTATSHWSENKNYCCTR